jgi:hypothetical protein
MTAVIYFLSSSDVHHMKTYLLTINKVSHNPARQHANGQCLSFTLNLSAHFPYFITTQFYKKK